ncbi:MAG: CHAT domain-containing protein [Phaeodactylibacter sp.]|nr:CHAT domain-containing protein [Phaeodactylibacter sp.]
MIRAFFTILLLPLCFSIAAQAVEYYNWNFQPTAKDSAAFYREITYDEEGKPVRKVRDYFITGELQWEGRLSSAQPDTLEGENTWYYKNGNIFAQGMYEDGQLISEYSVWLPNGERAQCHLSGEERQKLLGELSREFGLSYSEDIPSAYDVFNKSSHRLALHGPQKSLQILRLCSDIYLLNGDGYGWAFLENNMGFRFCELGQYDEALPIFERNLEMFRLLGNPYYEALALRGIGTVYTYGKPHFQKALEVLERSKELLEPMNNPVELFFADYNLCKLHLLLGNPVAPGIIPRIKSGIQMAEYVQQYNYKADLLAGLGNIYIFRERNDSAIIAYSEAIRLFEAVNLEQASINSLVGKAKAQMRSGQHEEAHQALSKAMRLTEKYGDQYSKANVLLAWGEWSVNKRDFGTGIKQFEQAGELFRQFNDQLNYAYTLHGMGMAYNTKGNYDEAIKNLQVALKIFEGLGTVRNIAHVHFYLGISWLRKTDYQEGENHFLRAIAIYDSLSLQLEKALALSCVGYIRLAKGQVDESEVFFAQSAEIYTAAGVPGQIFSQKMEKANLFRIAGRLDDAAETYQEAISDAHALGDLENVAFAHFALGELYYYYHGELEEAKKQYLLSEQFYLKTGKNLNAKFSRFSFAKVLFHLGDISQALEIYEDVLPAFEQSGEHMTCADIYNSLGLAYWHKDENEKALEYLEKSRAVYADTDNQDNPVFSQALGTLGDIYQDQLMPDKADAVFQRLRGIQERGQAEIQLANTLKNLGMVNTMQGNVDESTSLLLKAREIFEKENDINRLAEIDLFVMLNQIQSNDPEKAAASFEKATANINRLTDEEVKQVVTLMAAMYLSSEDEDERAIQLLERVLQSDTSQVGKTELTLTLSLLYATNGESKKARDLWDKSQEKKTENAEATPLFQYVMGNAAVIYYSEGNYQKAYEEAMKSLQFQEEQFASLSGEKAWMTLANVFYANLEVALACLKEMQKAEEAFTLAENSKAQILNRLIRERKFKEISLPEALQEKEQKLLDDLRNVDAALQQSGLPGTAREQLTAQKKLLLADFNVLKTEIRETLPAYSQAIYPEPVNMGQLQAALRSDEVMLSYFAGRYNAFAFLLGKDTLIMAPLGEPDVLKSAIRQFKDQYVQGSVRAILRGDIAGQKNLKDAFFRLSSTLNQILIEPLAPYIEGKKLVIIPHEELHYLPFELLVKDTASKPYGQYDYLVKRHAIAYYPSASTFFNERNRRNEAPAPTKDILAIGDPIFGAEENKDFQMDSLGFFRLRGKAYGEELPRLLYAKQELDAISGLFENASVLANTEATEDTLKAMDARQELKNYRYLHFSTHGLLNERYPDLSCIALNQDENEAEDGLLHAYEIFELNLNADLVVLSACGTGLGRLHKAEGMIGFSRSLMYAGTPSLILSLWPVDDQSTSELFKTYYQNLKANGGTDKQAPLRTAQLKLIESGEKHANPFFWAPFVFIGERQVNR